MRLRNTERNVEGSPPVARCLRIKLLAPAPSNVNQCHLGLTRSPGRKARFGKGTLLNLNLTSRSHGKRVALQSIKAPSYQLFTSPNSASHLCRHRSFHQCDFRSIATPWGPPNATAIPGALRQPSGRRFHRPGPENVPAQWTGGLATARTASFK